MNNELMAKESYVYELILKNAYVNESCFIKGNINVDKMKYLIFYIQCKYYDILPQSILTPSDLRDILVKCYGIESISIAEADEVINLDWNFNENFKKEKRDNIMNDYKMYDTKGLTRELRKIANLIIEQWR